MQYQTLINQTEARQMDFYRQMFAIRRVEETLLTLFSKGLLYGTVHTCLGQEACAVGVISALDRGRDVVWSNHRGHGHFLAYTGDIAGLIAEVMGKVTGVCGGIGGTQHLHAGGFYTNGVLGGTVACAVGAAFAEKLQGTGATSTVFFGDGAMGEGIIYESMNIAALWNLPVLFVLEHNRYAQSTPYQLEHAGRLEDRARPYGIETCEVDVTDVAEVHAIASRLVETIRAENRPIFLVLRTNRFAAHSKGDDTRPADEIAQMKQNDPVLRLRETLADAAPDMLNEIETEIEQAIAEAVEQATRAEHMQPDAFLERIAR